MQVDQFSTHTVVEDASDLSLTVNRLPERYIDGALITQKDILVLPHKNIDIISVQDHKLWISSRVY
jgi:hypothetical protein